MVHYTCYTTGKQDEVGYIYLKLSSDTLNNSIICFKILIQDKEESSRQKTFAF